MFLPPPSHRKKNSDGVPATPDVLASEFSMYPERPSRELKWMGCCLLLLLAIICVLVGMNSDRFIPRKQHATTHEATELGYDYVSRTGCQCTVSIPRGMAVSIKADGTQTATIKGGPQPMLPVRISTTEHITIAEAGQYQVFFGSSIGTSAAGTIARVGIYVNGTALAATQQTLIALVAPGQPISLSTLIHLKPGSTLDARWSTTATKAGTSVFCYARSFYAIRLGPL
jgi:hypothetical protein